MKDNHQDAMRDPIDASTSKLPADMQQFDLLALVSAGVKVAMLDTRAT